MDPLYARDMPDALVLLVYGLKYAQVKFSNWVGPILPFEMHGSYVTLHPRGGGL